MASGCLKDGEPRVQHCNSSARCRAACGGQGQAAPGTGHLLGDRPRLVQAMGSLGMAHSWAELWAAGDQHFCSTAGAGTDDLGGCNGRESWAGLGRDKVVILSLIWFDHFVNLIGWIISAMSLITPYSSKVRETYKLLKFSVVSREGDVNSSMS